MFPIHIQKFINQFDGLFKEVVYCLLSGDELSRHSDIFNKNTNACHSYISAIKNHVYLPIKKKKIKGSRVVEYYIDTKDLALMLISRESMIKVMAAQKVKVDRNRALREFNTFIRLKEKYAL